MTDDNIMSKHIFFSVELQPAFTIGVVLIMDFIVFTFDVTEVFLLNNVLSVLLIVIQGNDPFCTNYCFAVIIQV